jgi:hypothetical protein
MYQVSKVPQKVFSPGVISLGPTCEGIGSVPCGKFKKSSASRFSRKATRLSQKWQELEKIQLWFCNLRT